MQNSIHTFFGAQNESKFPGANKKKRNLHNLTLGQLPPKQALTDGIPAGPPSPAQQVAPRDSFERHNRINLELQDQLVNHVLNDFDKDAIVGLMLQHGDSIGINERDSQGRTVLTALAEKPPHSGMGLRKIVDFLCFLGADLSGTDASGRTAKLVAQHCGNSEILKLLEEKTRK